MRIPSMTASSGVGFNMTPMIDVVFQLIIFFLVSSHLAKRESQLELPLPIARSGEDDRESSDTRLTISVLASGELMAQGRTMSVDDVEQLLAARRSEIGEKLEVRLRSDRGTVYKHIEPLLLRCAKLNIWNVTYAVYPEEAQP
ncbi:Biopolymer transport protein ExbD/TolR [Pirellula staleyi DSM 6068]|uniref:Biopolymer transport protein ExbD/TolR n=1 Tax=Pirellula staleyi (strain ATCC 27377 / DSM 6068 / ICPB 4128) TaxID=530564 RepID=D2R7F5_PIRSD|nr:biopolymer transporter ExbD [Pirellula staleyi]ADB15651.1 Biopolymer transport protein ExbD/TolR [Pirellula staleyi DSM 6068]